MVDIWLQCTWRVKNRLADPPLSMTTAPRHWSRITSGTGELADTQNTEDHHPRSFSDARLRKSLRCTSSAQFHRRIFNGSYLRLWLHIQTQRKHTVIQANTDWSEEKWSVYNVERRKFRTKRNELQNLVQKRRKTRCYCKGASTQIGLSIQASIYSNVAFCNVHSRRAM